MWYIMQPHRVQQCGYVQIICLNYYSYIVNFAQYKI